MSTEQTFQMDYRLAAYYFQAGLYASAPVTIGADVKVTAFRRSVYDAVSRVPRGSVTTYKHVAREVGCRSCHAVGQALRANPFAPQVPCHRVIASDLTVGGYQGESGGGSVRRKIRLLAEEGVFFRGGKLAETDRVFRFG